MGGSDAARELKISGLITCADNVLDRAERVASNLDSVAKTYVGMTAGPPKQVEAKVATPEAPGGVARIRIVMEKLNAALSEMEHALEQF